MAIYELAQDTIRLLATTRFGDEGIRERGDLQRLLRDQIDVIAPDTMVIAEEFGQFEESQRRIDLLALDKDANIVVIELKRGRTGAHMELQAIRYAAMVSTMTFEQVVAAHEKYLADRGADAEDAEQQILDHLGWEEASEEDFGQDVRIVLVAADFSKELTTAVLWLNQRELDIRCVRLRPYSLDGRVLMDVQPVVPLPEAEEFQIRVREKARKERVERTSGRDLTKFDVTIDGQTFERLAKRQAAYAVIRALCDRGVSPEKITNIIGRSQNRIWRVVDGHVKADEFVNRARDVAESGGPAFRPRRWFCADEELIRTDGRTWALTKMWGRPTEQRLDALTKSLGDDCVAYRANST